MAWAKGSRTAGYLPQVVLFYISACPTHPQTPTVLTSRPRDHTQPHRADPDPPRVTCNLSLAFHSLTHFVPKPSKSRHNTGPPQLAHPSSAHRVPQGPTGSHRISTGSVSSPSNGSAAQLWSEYPCVCMRLLNPSVEGVRAPHS